MPFHSKRTYDDGLNVRDYTRLLDVITTQPNGKLRLLIAPRRFGKTWSLRALEHKLHGKGQAAQYVSLDAATDRKAFDKNAFPGVLLIDEPGRYFPAKAKQELTSQGYSRASVEAFLDRCEKLESKGTRVFVALTPRELGALVEVDDDHGRINRNDLQSLEPFGPALALSLVTKDQQPAAPAAWTTTLLNQLPASWLRNPYLLELFFETAEKTPALQTDLTAALEATVSAARRTPSYVSQVYDDALTEDHRRVLRAVAWEQTDRALRPTEIVDLLITAGLLMGDELTLSIADPIVARHLPPPLRIHHLSDIHVGDKAAAVVDQKADGTTATKLTMAAGESKVRDSYLNHVQALGPNAPHLIVISGDIAEMGHDSLYEEAKVWLAKLKPLLCVDHPRLRSTEKDPRVIVVGGNHDVDWKHTLGSAGARHRHLPFARAFDDLPRPKLEEPPEKRDLTSVEYREAGVLFSLLGSAEFGGDQEEDPAWQHVVGYINQIAERATSEFEKADWKKSQKLLENITRVDPGLVHHDDLVRVRELPTTAPGKRCSVKIAVLHHPVSPMPQGPEIARLPGLLNAGQVKDALLEAQFCLVLHGHMHSGWFAIEQWPGQHNDWKLRIASAATLGSRELAEHHGFNEVRILWEGDEPSIEIRRFGRDGNSWTTKAILGPFHPGK